MKKTFLITVLMLLSLQSQATTAIMCGNPEVVDEDNAKATVHIILDNSDSGDPSEISLAMSGKSKLISNIETTDSELEISLGKSKNVKSLVIEKKYYNPESCELYSEDTFNIHMKSNNHIKTIENCRCFQD